MATPTTPLALTLDVDELTLNDIELFEPGGFSVKRYKAFMVAHSNWTAAEVGALTLAEMKAVGLKIGEALASAALPKAS